MSIGHQGSIQMSLTLTACPRRIGRQLLLRMLRADGPNRGAWADPSRMTPEIVDIYRRPAKLLNWGSALIQV